MAKKTLGQIEQQLKELQREKRNIKRRERRAETETLGQVSAKAKISKEELENLIRLYDLLKQNNHSIGQTYKLLHNYFIDLSKKTQQ